MRILQLTVLRGPNHWSSYRQQLIEMLLDLEAFEALPTNRIDGFAERLEALMPSLYSHRCSEDEEGGFFERVRIGTWMGHVAEHVALELQSLAGMECGYGRTRSADKDGVYHVVFAFEIAEAGLYAARASVNIVRALAAGKPVDAERTIALLKAMKARHEKAAVNMVMEMA